MTRVTSPSGIPRVTTAGDGTLRAWVESGYGHSEETAVTSRSACQRMAAAWMECARQLDSRVRGPRIEPNYSRNWFCKSCLSLCVGDKPDDGVCDGCKDAGPDGAP